MTGLNEEVNVDPLDRQERHNISISMEELQSEQKKETGRVYNTEILYSLESPGVWIQSVSSRLVKRPVINSS